MSWWDDLVAALLASDAPTEGDDPDVLVDGSTKVDMPSIEIAKT